MIEIAECSQVQYAIIPIPALLWGGGVVAAIILARLLYKKLKRHKFCVLGMQAAGKTQLIAHLNNQDYGKTYKPSGKEHYTGSSAVTWNLGKIRVAPGYDLGGGEAFIPEYKEAIENAEFVFFMFDADKYLHHECYPDENDYRRQTNARLDLVYDLLGKKKCAVIASRLDKIKERDELNNIKDKIINAMNKERQKPYARLLTGYFDILDVRDKETTLKFVKHFIENIE